MYRVSFKLLLRRVAAGVAVGPGGEGEGQRGHEALAGGGRVVTLSARSRTSPSEGSGRSVAAGSSTQGGVTDEQVALLPVGARRSVDTIPGLVTATIGRGKATQYYLRGFQTRPRHDFVADRSPGCRSKMATTRTGTGHRCAIS